MARGSIRDRVTQLDSEPAIEGALRQMALGRSVIPVWSPDLSKPQGANGLYPCMCPKGADCESPGKHPAVARLKDGQGFANSFIRDEQQLRTVLNNPGTRNYGVIPAPGEVFLDLDGEGMATWKALIAELGPPPPTDLQKTANGYHAAFKLSDDPGGNLFDIVTRRYPGGFVVGEGSMHPTGTRYSHLGPRTVADLPESYTKRANEARAEVRANPVDAKDVPMGKRHDFLRDQARYMHGRGLSDKQVLEVLRAFNADFAVPKTEEEVIQAMGDLSHFPVDPPPITLTFDTPKRVTVASVKPQRERKERGKRSRRLSTFDIEDIEWLMEGWFPKGEIAIIEGMSSMSKSTVMVDIIARVTSGRDFPDGSRNHVGPASVLYITGEDSPQRVLLPRVLAAGGDPERIVFYDDDFVMPDDLDCLADELDDDPEIALVLIDPLFSHLDSDINTGKDTEVRRKIMDPLQEIAAEKKVVICVSRHVNKMSGQSIHLRGSGSYGALTARARCTMSIIKNPDAPDGIEERLFGVTKINYARLPDPLKFTVGDYYMQGTEGYHAERVTGKTQPVIVWGGSYKIDMDDAQARNESSRAAKGGETKRNTTLEDLKQIVMHHPQAVRQQWHTTEHGSFPGIGLPKDVLLGAYWAAGGEVREVTLSNNWIMAPGFKIKADANGVQGKNSAGFKSWWVLALTSAPSDTESVVSTVSTGSTTDHWRVKRAREATPEAFDLAEDDSND